MLLPDSHARDRFEPSLALDEDPPRPVDHHLGDRGVDEQMRDGPEKRQDDVDALFVHWLRLVTDAWRALSRLEPPLDRDARSREEEPAAARAPGARGAYARGRHTA